MFPERGELQEAIPKLVIALSKDFLLMEEQDDSDDLVDMSQVEELGWHALEGVLADAVALSLGEDLRDYLN